MDAVWDLNGYKLKEKHFIHAEVQTKHLHQPLLCVGRWLGLSSALVTTPIFLYKFKISFGFFITPEFRMCFFLTGLFILKLI